MAAGSTYTPIATTTLGSSASSYTFSSIPSTYTDLVLVFNGSCSGNQSYLFQFNGDTGTNYSETGMYGNGTTAGSFRDSNQTYVNIGGLWTTLSMNVANIMNYANTTTYKTVIARNSNGSQETSTAVSLWRSFAAINSVKVFPTAGTFTTGSTFTLWGILNA